MLPDTATAQWYEDKVRRFGYDHRGLGFRSRSSQEKRFGALASLGDFHGRTLLDVGCGFGDFLDYLRAQGIEPRYTGIDICAPMIQRCRERFTDEAATFEVADVLEYAPARQYDYVVASGIFGLETPVTRERIEPTLRRMTSWARLGCAANFLSQFSASHAEARVYVDPCDVLNIGLVIAPAARLDHSYLPNDFTLFLYPQPPWEGEKVSNP